MANPKYAKNQFSYSFAQPEHLFGKISFGASGAPTIAANTSMGINSISRVSAGKYNITLSHSYFALLNLKHVFNSGSSAPASPGMYISSDTSSSVSAPVIQIVFNAAGTPTDPASGEIVLLDICLQKSSVRY